MFFSDRQVQVLPRPDGWAIQSYGQESTLQEKEVNYKKFLYCNIFLFKQIVTVLVEYRYIRFFFVVLVKYEVKAYIIV
jgi:hypothetical protein